MQAEPSVIVPGLYLGSHNHGNNPELLGQMGITHVVDCCCLPKSRVDSITYLDLDLDDHVDFKISNYFDRACKFMEQALDAGGNVLVHCQMGRSRSVTIVVAFLMYKFPRFRNFQDALSFITSQHPVSDPNFSFIDQLRHWGSDQSRGPRIFPDSPY